MMTCDWCGKEFPADARACVEAGFDTLHVPEAIMGEEWKGAHAAAVDPESIPPEKRDEMKAAMGLDDAQLIELLTTGEVRGLGAIVCIECQDSGEVDDQ